MNPSALCYFVVNSFIKKYIVCTNMDGIFQQEYSDSSVPARSARCHENAKSFFLLFRNSFVYFLPADRKSPTATINRKKNIQLIFGNVAEPLDFFRQKIFIFKF